LQLSVTDEKLTIFIHILQSAKPQPLSPFLHAPHQSISETT
jgi:hypothetical protein